MIRRIFLSLTLILSIGGIYAQDKVEPLDTFKELRTRTFNKLPFTFTGVVSSKAVSEKLKEIPKNAYTDKNKKPYLEVRFSKAEGIELEVKNVDEFYADMFSDYVRFFQLGPVLAVKNSEKMLKKYKFSFAITKKKDILLEMQLKNANNYFRIYIKPGDYKVERVDYFMEKALLSSTTLDYAKMKSDKGGITYMIPNRFKVTFKEKGKTQSQEFKIINIKTSKLKKLF